MHTVGSRDGQVRDSIPSLAWFDRRKPQNVNPYSWSPGQCANWAPPAYMSKRSSTEPDCLAAHLH
jgi:hypothetical protein